MHHVTITDMVIALKHVNFEGLFVKEGVLDIILSLVLVKVIVIRPKGQQCAD